MSSVPNITYEQVYNRLIAQLPPWFGNQQFVEVPPPDTFTSTTNFNNVMWSYIITSFTSYYQFQYDWMQMRIGAYETGNINGRPNDPNWPNNIPPELPLYPLATGDNLDLIAQDFFGDGFPRRPGESDDNYRNRILSSVMKIKASRPAMYAALLNLVTPAFQQYDLPVVPPEIYEGFEASDNGVLNRDDPVTMAFGTPGGVYGIGSYGSEYGLFAAPYTCLIIVYLPSGNGMANYPGYSTQGSAVSWGAGFGTNGTTQWPPQWFGSETLLNFYITESDIVHLINLTKVLGTICFLQIIYVN